MHRHLLAFLMLTGFAGRAWAQVDTLALSSASTSAGGTVSLALALNSPGTAPAALQWTFGYIPGNIASFSVTAGSSANSAAKSLTCASPQSGTYTCILAGINANLIPNGVVANVTVTLAPTTSSTTISVVNTMGAALDGSGVTVTGSGGTITASGQTQTVVSGLSCNPSTLGSSSASTCTVSLNQATASATSVSLSSNTAALTVPASVVVAAGAASATFTASAGTISSNQTATITATYNGSATASISLVGQAGVISVTSVACSPSSLNSSATASCSVTLSGAAPAGGATVTLSSSNALLIVPASAFVPAGATSTVVGALAGTISANQTATITATYNGSATASISLVSQAGVSVSSVSCSPTSLNSSAPSSCSVTLSAAAPAGGAVVTLSSSTALLTMPASAVVAAGFTSVNFTAVSGTIPADQSATITATYNGSATASISLLARVTVTALSCSPTSLNSGAISACTVTLSKAAPTGGATVTLTSTNGLLAVPATISVPAGNASATFTANAGTIATAQAATIAASYNGSSAAQLVSLTTATVISGVSCVPATLNQGDTTTCTVTLSRPAPAGGASVSLSSSAAALPVLSSITVPAGSTSVMFTATAGSIATDQSTSITGSYNGGSATATLSLLGRIGITQFSCSPSTLSSGGVTPCTVTLSRVAPAGGAIVSVSSSNALLTVPAIISVPAGNTFATFTASAGSFSSDQSALITVSYNGSSTTASISLGSGTTVSQVSCSPASLAPGASAVCTVTLSRAVAGAAAVTLSSSAAAVTVPSAVTVNAGSASSTFTATAAAGATSQTASITASYNGSSASASLGVAVSLAPSSLICSASTMDPGSTGTCTVTLTQPAGGSGASVSIVSNNPILTVPGTAFVPAGSASTTFTVTAGAGAGAATVAATLNGVSVAATISIQQQSGLRVTQVNCDSSIHSSNSLVSCTYTLSAAVAGTPVVPTVLSDNPLLSPIGVLAVQPGSTSGSLQFRVGTVTADQSATVSVSVGTSTASTTVTISSPPTLQSFVCSSGTLTAGASLSCTVTMSRQLGAESVSVSLGGAPDVTVPASVTISPGQSSASFTAQVKAAPGNTTDVITASWSGVSISFTLSASAAVISSLACAPSSLEPGAAANCTIILTAAATSSTSVSLGSSSPDLSVPGSVTVASGATTATFSATSASPASDEQVTVTATLGSLSQTSNLTLLGGPRITSFDCTPTTVIAGATTQCSLLLSRSAGDLVITISSTGAPEGLSIPSSVLIPAGRSTSSFTVTVPASGGTSFQITVTLGSSARSLTINVGQSAISTLACNPDMGASGALACSVALSQPAAADTMINLQSDNSQIQIPAQVRIAAGTSAAQFAAGVPASDQDQRFQLTAAMQGVTRSIPVAVLGIKPTRMLCTPVAVRAGDPLTCSVRLTASNVPSVARLNITSGNAGLHFPALIATRPGQTDLSFKVFTDPMAPQQPSAIVATFGQTQAAAIVTVTGDSNPRLALPGRQYASFGNAATFTVAAADPNALSLVLSVTNLPTGANFDPNTGIFSWTPDQTQGGVYTVTFTATNSNGGTASGDVTVQVDAGLPVITDVRNGASQIAGMACSPGSVATLLGRWLAPANPPVSDLTGASTQLGGARVNVNSSYVPVLYASATRIDFVCPAADPGTALNISVENSAGSSDATQITMQAIAPAIFSADASGQGQGMVTLTGTSLLATPRSYLNVGQPAEPGDSITILVTGLGSAPALPQITLGGISVTALSVDPIASLAGVYQVVANLPSGLPVGDALPLQIGVIAPDSSTVQSNTVTVAIESARQLN